MELFQHGILTEKNLGFPLEWGDGEAVVKLIDMIARREGFGSILAEGEARASKKIGNGSHKYALTIKGLEQHETLRAIRAGALAQATSTRGADHLRRHPHIEGFAAFPEEEALRIFGHKEAVDPTTYDYKAPLVVLYEKYATLFDMLETCKFFSFWLSPYITADLWAPLFSSATGVESTAKDLLQAAERVYNLERIFIVREGARRQDDYPTWRDFKEPLPSGPHARQVLDKKKYSQMLDEYYRVHGWDSNGKPTESTLKELGIEAFARQVDKTH